MSNEYRDAFGIIRDRVNNILDVYADDHTSIDDDDYELMSSLSSYLNKCEDMICNIR